MEDTISDQKRISLKARGKRKSDGGRSDFTVSFALSMIDRLPSVSKYGHKITHEESSSKRKVRQILFSPIFKPLILCFINDVFFIFASGG